VCCARPYVVGRDTHTQHTAWHTTAISTLASMFLPAGRGSARAGTRLHRAQPSGRGTFGGIVQPGTVRSRLPHDSLSQLRDGRIDAISPDSSGSFGRCVEVSRADARLT